MEGFKPRLLVLSHRAGSEVTTGVPQVPVSIRSHTSAQLRFEGKLRLVVPTEEHVKPTVYKHRCTAFTIIILLTYHPQNCYRPSQSNSGTLHLFKFLSNVI